MPKTQHKMAGRWGVGSLIQRVILGTHLTHPCVQQKSAVLSMRRARSIIARAETGPEPLSMEHAQSALAGRQW